MSPTSMGVDSLSDADVSEILAIQVSTLTPPFQK